MPLKTPLSNWVVFADNCLTVINKPAGVVVDRAETTSRRQTLEDLLPENGLRRRGIVHRLDKDTSGLLVVAKTAAALEQLQQQFKLRQVKKNYSALVHGRVEPSSGRINLPIARNPRRRHRFGVFIGGRPAVTEYSVRSYWPGYTLMEINLHTGRTHQIRVHFKHLNHPLVTDPFYLGKKRLKADLIWCPRLFLHSRALSFVHPLTKKIINFSVPLPDELKQALQKIPA